MDYFFTLIAGVAIGGFSAYAVLGDTIIELRMKVRHLTDERDMLQIAYDGLTSTKGKTE